MPGENCVTRFARDRPLRLGDFFDRINKIYRISEEDFCVSSILLTLFILSKNLARLIKNVHLNI